MKKVLILSGSPRKDGNSDLLCSEFMRGAQESGNEVQKIFVRSKKIVPCNACYYCRDHGGKCALNDDMSEILDAMQAADVIVMASPVYFYSIDAQMKIIIDRSLARWTNIPNKEFYFIADTVGADLFEVVPSDPYTSDDLNWTNNDSRVSREHNDEGLRAVALESTDVDGWDDYDTVFIGYPIWWGIAAWPMSSFVAVNDFTGKTVIPFCTSVSSGIGQSGELLAELVDAGTWLDGQRFSRGSSEADIASWVNGLNL